MPEPPPSPARAATGALIFSLFGSVWMIAWVLRTPGIRPLPGSLGVLPGPLLFLAALRRLRRLRQTGEPDPPEAPGIRRAFIWVNLGQGLAIFLAANVAANLHHPEWFVPAFIFIVGAHFLPLAALFRTRRHLATGLALMALAITYPLLARGGPSSSIGCLGAGLILWANALGGLAPLG